jgi:hypothetical protein
MENLLVYVLKESIDSWKGFNNKPITYFYIHYFRQSKQIKLKAYIQRLQENKTFLFKCMLEDGFTSEQTVKLNLKSKLEKRRLSIKLKELNIEPYNVRIVTHFPKCNKHENFSEVYYNGTEIIY